MPPIPNQTSRLEILLDKVFRTRLDHCLQKYSLLQKSGEGLPVHSESLVVLDQALCRCEREYAGLLSSPKVSGLSQALAQVVSEMRASGVNVSFECFGAAPELGDEQQHNCLDLIKECCSNAIKHGGGNAIAILLVNESEGLRISISDNGGGFSELDNATGQGVRTMRKRVEEMGGEIEFQTNSRMGATVNLCLPLPDNKECLKGKGKQGVETWSMLEAQGLGRRLHDSFCQCLVAAVMAADMFVDTLPEGNDEVWESGKILSIALQDLLQTARKLSHQLTDYGVEGVDIDSMLQSDS